MKGLGAEREEQLEETRGAVKGDGGGVGRVSARRGKGRSERRMR